jgi:hypothetical protein
LALVVDASIGLKWVLEEPDSHLAEALVHIEPDLLRSGLLAERGNQRPVAPGAAEFVHAGASRPGIGLA